MLVNWLFVAGIELLSGKTVNVLIPDIFSFPVFETFSEIEFVTVAAKLALSSKAAASSFNVFKVSGAESTKFAIAV